MRIQELNKEIDDCIKFLVDEGICHRYLNTHIENKSIVPYGGNPGFVKFSSFREYKNWVKEIEENNQFVIILFDGSIISFSYDYKDNTIIKQMRCLYLPNIYIYSQELLSELPDEEDLELMSNTNESLFYHPLRFDYLNPDCVREQRDDPYCHIHLGFLEESRLPINAPINPKIII